MFGKCMARLAGGPESTPAGRAAEAGKGPEGGEAGGEEGEGAGFGDDEHAVGWRGRDGGLIV